MDDWGEDGKILASSLSLQFKYSRTVVSLAERRIPQHALPDHFALSSFIYVSHSTSLSSIVQERRHLQDLVARVFASTVSVFTTLLSLTLETSDLANLLTYGFIIVQNDNTSTLKIDFEEISLLISRSSQSSNLFRSATASSFSLLEHSSTAIA